MPRKNKGMWYEVHPTPVKGENGKNLVYVRPKSGLKMTMKQLESYCERNYSLRYGEMSRAFDMFIRAAGWFLAEGYRIETPIGSFAPKLSLVKQITDPDMVKDRDVRLEGVEYNPGKLWKKEAEKWLDGFRPVRNGNTEEIMSDSERLREVLDRYVSKGGMVTARQFAAATGLTYYSARKQLDAWTEGEKPLLMRSKMGKIFIYTAI
jgi:hypothetical protein